MLGATSKLPTKLLQMKSFLQVCVHLNHFHPSTNIYASTCHVALHSTTGNQISSHLPASSIEDSEFTLSKSSPTMCKEYMYLCTYNYLCINISIYHIYIYVHIHDVYIYIMFDLLPFCRFKVKNQKKNGVTWAWENLSSRAVPMFSSVSP